MEELQSIVRMRERMEACYEARHDLLRFTRLSMPRSEDVDNVNLSRYIVAEHHRSIAEELHRVRTGKTLRLILTLPPRFGKSQLASKSFIPWFVGEDPSRQVIFATYAQTFAEDFGRYVRDLMLSPLYNQVFPDCRVSRDSRSAARIGTEDGGTSVFVGRGGPITGRGADLALIDDPLKDREEADSQTIRDQLWEWYWSVLYTRLMPGGRIVIIQTRWHEDDLVGRLTNPSSEFYDEEEASKWRVVNYPALGEDGVSLWPERYSAEYLCSIRKMNPRMFNALYQQNPTPPEGNFFKASWIRNCSQRDLPPDLQYYAASDHAVSTSKDGNYTCMVIAGVDQNDDIYIVDCWWEKESSEHVVAAMLRLMQKWRPITWWAEKGHISMSIGPFLRQRMKEERVYINLEELVPVKSKEARAQSIQGRMSMGKVYLLKGAPWYARALQELLKFPFGATDDFVDPLAHLGMGLDKMVGGRLHKPKGKVVQIGSLAWVKQAHREEQRHNKLAKNRGFM